MAGVYAATDAARGVWKAPANVGLADVSSRSSRSPTRSRTRSTSTPRPASRSTPSVPSRQGHLVWGARTLAGNDNEWRYISVRRFFNMVEESVKKSTYWAVFEPNDANTWVKVRGMIENYLIDKWREGALAGATPKDAFFVRCGLGTTMSAAGHPRGPDDRRDRHGGRAAGRIHHPEVLPQAADLVAAEEGRSPWPTPSAVSATGLPLHRRVGRQARRLLRGAGAHPGEPGHRVSRRLVPRVLVDQDARHPQVRQHHAEARDRERRQRVLRVAQHGEAEHRASAATWSSACSTKSTSR